MKSRSSVSEETKNGALQYARAHQINRQTRHKVPGSLPPAQLEANHASGNQPTFIAQF